MAESSAGRVASLSQESNSRLARLRLQSWQQLAGKACSSIAALNRRVRVDGGYIWPLALPWKGRSINMKRKLLGATAGARGLRSGLTDLSTWLRGVVTGAGQATWSRQFLDWVQRHTYSCWLGGWAVTQQGTGWQFGMAGSMLLRGSALPRGAAHRWVKGNRS